MPRMWGWIRDEGEATSADPLRPLQYYDKVILISHLYFHN